MKTRGNKRLNSIFGCPYTQDMKLDSKWYEANIVRIDLPFRMVLAWDTDKAVTQIAVHKLAAKKFQQALNNVAVKARQLCKLTHGYDQTSEFYDAEVANLLHTLHLDLFGGTFNFRAMRGSTNISRHSYGIAIDIDPGHNPLGKTATTLPEWYRACWEKAGFAWGGKWNRSDCMHFEVKT